MKKIKEYSEASAALFLIKEHTIGDLRDESDLHNSQYHASVTIEFLIDLLENISGTVEEKLEFLLKVKTEIPKFNAKHKNGD